MVSGVAVVEEDVTEESTAEELDCVELVVEAAVVVVVVDVALVVVVLRGLLVVVVGRGLRDGLGRGGGRGTYSTTGGLL